MSFYQERVPKFGEWNQDTPFSIVFEKASKSKKDKTIPNTESPEMNPKPTQTRNHRHDQTPNHNVRASRHERFSSKEETEFRPFTPSPAHNERNMRVRAPPTTDTYNHQSYGGGGCRFVGIPSETNRREPHNSPAPVHPRPIRNLRGRSSERVASVPPFPGSGSDNQSYTLIFDKVKEDRNQNQSGTGRFYNVTAQSTSTQPINNKHHNQLPYSPKGCCFPWSRK